MQFDGREILTWRGDYSRLSLLAEWQRIVNSPFRLFLGTHCDWHFKGIWLTPLSDASRLPDTDGEPAVDLLKRIELKRHIVRGPWAFDGPALVAPPNVGHAIVRVPGAVPDDYHLRMVVELPRDHQGLHEFAFGLVTHPTQVHVVLDSGGTSGFESVGGKGHDANEATFRGQLFLPGVESTIDCLVRKNNIQIDFDGRTIIDCTGDRGRLSSGWLKVGAPRRNLYLGTHHKFFIKKMELLPLKERRPSDGWPVARKPIDVLDLIRPSRDAVKGRWTVDGGALVSPADEHLACIKLPVRMPDQYSVTVEATRIKGQHPTLHVGLVNGDRQFLAILNASDGRSGLDLIDGSRYDGNETTTDKARLVEGVTATIECTVTKGGIQATLDGKTIIDWHGDRNRLSVLSLWPGRAVPGLFLATHGSYRFSRVEIRAVTFEP